MRDLVGEQQISCLGERGDDLGRRLVRRVEVTVRVALLGDRPGESGVGVLRDASEIDGRALGIGRRRYGMVQERQQHFEVEHLGESLARLSQRALVVHVRPIDIAVEQPPRRVADQRNQEAHCDDRQNDRAELLGCEVI